MGTSTMGGDLHSDKQDKLLKLQARKKELELMLASKNEELYKLCVQEVQLTGVMPPEAPLSPDVPRQRLNSVRSADSADVQDGADCSARRLRGERADAEPSARKNLCHRLSTPSLTGAAAKSALPRHPRRPDTSCSNFFPSPPQERNPDTFSIHTSHTCPALVARLDPAPPDASHYSNKMYFNPAPEQHAARLRDTHFSSSHPDIAAHYAHAPPVPPPARPAPLLYQYASQLKAQSQHLSALSHHHQLQLHARRRADGVRRNTLQRTQTYHLTSHSDYTQHLDTMTPHAYAHRSQPDIPEHTGGRPAPALGERSVPVPNTLPLRERTSRLPLHMQLQVSTDDCDDPSPLAHSASYSPTFDSVSMNKFSPMSPLDGRIKEKQWYETSLDAPARYEPALRKSASLKRTPSAATSQQYEVMISSGRHSALQSPPVLSPGAVSLESPNNMTVIEQGKCIPYREETKPFEMSDFYKYSTKFRQATATRSAPPAHAYSKLPAELPQCSPDQWHGYAN